MRSKSNKRCRNINGQPFGTETSNNTQNSDCHYISGLPDGELPMSAENTYLPSPFNNSANTGSLPQQSIVDECQPYGQPFNDNATFLGSRFKYRKVQLNSLTVAYAQQHQHIPPNIKHHVSNDSHPTRFANESWYLRSHQKAATESHDVSHNLCHRFDEGSSAFANQENQKTASPFTPPQLIEGLKSLPQNKQKRSNAQKHLYFNEHNVMPYKENDAPPLMHNAVDYADNCHRGC